MTISKSGMRLRHILLLAGIAAIGSSAALRSEPAQSATSGSTSRLLPPPQARGYSLVAADNFSAFDLSPDGKGDHVWYNPGMHWEPPAPYRNIVATGSGLTLYWTRGQTPAGDTSIATAAPDGSHYHAWQYGYFEARVKWENTTTGSWPAVWMIPIEGIIDRSKDTGEIDIMEGSGNNPSHGYYATVHEWLNGKDVHSNNRSNRWVAPAGTNMSQFHTYGVRWVPGSVTWYFDDQRVFSYPTTPAIDAGHYFLILGSQEGVEGGATAYGNTTGVTASKIGMQVEWVRVWQH